MFTTTHWRDDVIQLCCCEEYESIIEAASLRAAEGPLYLATSASLCKVRCSESQQQKKIQMFIISTDFTGIIASPFFDSRHLNSCLCIILFCEEGL
ncbi:hypothetical protein CUMW_140830, partial [Citrus unshiu]